MRQQSRYWFDSNTPMLPAFTFRPCLEEIETRLLPGEAVGLGFLASFDLLDSVLSFPWARCEPALVSTELVRTTEAVDIKEPGLMAVANDSDQRSLITATRSPSVASDQPPWAVRDAVFAGNALTNTLTDASLDPSALFAAARLRSPHAVAAANSSGTPGGSGTDSM